MILGKQRSRLESSPTNVSTAIAIAVVRTSAAKSQGCEDDSLAKEIDMGKEPKTIVHGTDV